MESFTIYPKTFMATYKGKKLSIKFPHETISTELETEEKAKIACLWIKENGVYMDEDYINTFLMDV